MFSYRKSNELHKIWRERKKKKQQILIGNAVQLLHLCVVFFFFAIRHRVVGRFFFCRSFSRFSTLTLLLSFYLFVCFVYSVALYILKFNQYADTITQHTYVYIMYVYVVFAMELTTNSSSFHFNFNAVLCFFFLKYAARLLLICVTKIIK